jgi:RimJ/RimL family protein N-acetyltransferase
LASVSRASATPVSITIRRAAAEDVDFLVGLANDPEVEPFLGGRALLDRDGLLAEVERSQREPHLFGRFVIEEGGEPAGSLGFECTNARSGIARLERLAVAPGRRGRGIADEAARTLQRHLVLELGFHRLELEIYGFNERAQRHAERVGFVREAVKRRAYLRHGEWVDAVAYSLLREDLKLGLVREYVAAHNGGVRLGAWCGLEPCFHDDAELVFDGIPIGPFRGRHEIVAAYERQPPDDTVELLGVDDDGAGTAVAGYAWSASPGVRAGELRFEHRDGRITRLVVTL